jgi:signal transduction histidine kinase
VLRVVLLVHAVALNLYRADNLQRPVGGLVVVLVMIAWTAFTVWAYADPARRTPLVLVLDLAVALATVLATPVVKGAGFSATVPGFWVMGALLAWAVVWRWRGGLVAAVVLAAVDLGLRQDVSQTNYANVFLLLLGGVVIGGLAESLQRMAEQRDAAEREAAAAAERVRLARAVHDGVLQVLALVQRRGAELGGEAAELGRLAGEQEAVLRGLIHAQDAVPDAPSGTLDVAAELARLERPGVVVAGPGVPVELGEHAGRELVAAVAACLDNVARHAPGARTWVLLEGLPDRVEVSVRDDGPGIPEGRLAEAAGQGRLGVRESICGRIADLNGRATLTTGPDGTEWELSVPREAT